MTQLVYRRSNVDGCLLIAWWEYIVTITWHAFRVTFIQFLSLKILVDKMHKYSSILCLFSRRFIFKRPFSFKAQPIFLPTNSRIDELGKSGINSRF